MRCSSASAWSRSSTLPMQLIDAQYTLDNSQVLIHFLSENRVDFRELVRELARELHTRIELRQVGVRDEAKLIGGYGICGRKLCCSTFLATSHRWPSAWRKTRDWRSTRKRSPERAAA